MGIVFEKGPQSDLIRIPTRFGGVTLPVVDEAYLDLEHSLVENILLERLAAIHTLHESVDEERPALGVVIPH